MKKVLSCGFTAAAVPAASAMTLQDYREASVPIDWLFWLSLTAVCVLAACAICYVAQRGWSAYAEWRFLKWLEETH
jgi:hypothetical protein